MAGKRSIFEEVEAGAQVASAAGTINRNRGAGRSAIRAWLLLIFMLVATMIVVGGLTRLTDSGLSITEWKPVTGAIPPMDDAAWAVEFGKYQASPEFQLQNSAMTLAEFKGIYWWEWGHRQLGRVIGLVWAVGFAGLALARKIPPGWSRRIWLLGGLGGLQGAVGWWMVSSGLKGTMVDVASLRLAVHLGLAFVIFGVVAWYVLLLGRSEAALLQARRGREAKLYGMSTGLLHMTFVQVLLGALVAGIDAGRGFPTWPLMNGSFVSAKDQEGLVRGFIGASNENVRREGGRVLLDKVIDVPFASQLDGGKAVLAAIENGGPIHTSTGLFCNLEPCAGDQADGAAHIARNPSGTTPALELDSGRFIAVY